MAVDDWLAESEGAKESMPRDVKQKIIKSA